MQLKVFTVKYRPLWDIAVSFERDGVIAFDLRASEVSEVLNAPRKHLYAVGLGNVHILETFCENTPKYGYAYLFYDGNRMSSDDAIAQLLSSS